MDAITTPTASLAIERLRKRMPTATMTDPKILGPAVWDSIRKLHPRSMIKNPVMFVVEVVASLTTILFIRDLVTGGPNLGFSFQINLWLWFTVIVRQFCRSRRRRAAAKPRRQPCARPRPSTMAKLLDRGARLAAGAGIRLSNRETSSWSRRAISFPSDGEVIEGVASVNELAITGESAPVIRESGGDRSAVTGGTQVISDQIKVKITAAQGSTFLDRMIALVEGAERQKTPNEIALNILLAGMTLIFVFAVVDYSRFCCLCRRQTDGPGACRTFCDAHSHNHRRPPVRDRHRRHGSFGALQCARDVGARG